MRIAGGAALLAVMISATAADDPAAPARPDDAAMAAMVDHQVALARKGRLREAQRALERKLNATRDPLVRADMIEAFGIGLVAAASDAGDRPVIEAALDYLTRAVDSYRLLLGNDSPELATALVRRAEVERLLRPDDPNLSADVAYESAYRIRAAALGQAAPVTLSTLIPMALLQALPARAKGDPAKLDAAAALLRQVIEATDGSADPLARDLHADALDAMRTVQGAYGDGRRLLPPAAGGIRACIGASTDDVMIFSGEPAALRIVEQRFKQARLTLRPCDGSLLFVMSRGTDPTPVLDLLGDISAGRMKGVRTSLVEGRSALSVP